MKSRRTPSPVFAVLTALAVHAAFTTAVRGAAAGPGDVFGAIRNWDRAAAKAGVLAGAGGVEMRDAAGDTPLIAAAAAGDRELAEWLLGRGASVNATNLAGVTALMRGATDDGLVRLLLDRGADPAIRSGLGNTALHLAARPCDAARTVGRLLKRGADPNVANLFGATPLMAAVAAGDRESVRLLLDHGADANAAPIMAPEGLIMGGGRTPLMWAAFRGHGEIARELLGRGARVDVPAIGGSALSQAAWSGSTEVARMLLAAGAPVDSRDPFANYTPLHWVASSESGDASMATLLLQHGADANAEGGQPVDGFLGELQTPLKLALKRGETPIVRALRAAGAREGSRPSPKPEGPGAWPEGVEVGPATLSAAVGLAVPPLQRTGRESRAAFLRHASRQDCVSCHQQHLPLAAVSLARARGFAVDGAQVATQQGLIAKFGSDFAETDRQTTFHPEPAYGNGYGLLSLRLSGYPASAETDASVHQLMVIQSSDGAWDWNLPRPPIQTGRIGATALAVHALRFFGLPGHERETERRIGRARAWLRRARGGTGDDLAYRVLGLAWSGETRAGLRDAAADLRRAQRPDGGWAQLPGLGSDAFATGQAVFALLDSGVAKARDGSVRDGLRFLLRNQRADGTWHAARRAFPFQPPMDSGFPHGADSWLSAAASSWAVMALASALDSSRAPDAGPVAVAAAGPGMERGGSAGSGPSGAPGVAPVDFARDIQPLLERSCVPCHGGERPKGGLLATDRAALLKGGNRGEPGAIPGNPSGSLLVRVASDQVEDMEMPPLNRRDRYPALSGEEIGLLRGWIEKGAR